MDLPENKRSLTLFLSNQLIKCTPEIGSDLVISGGFSEADRVVSCAGHDVTSLCATHEEADTRIILHAHHAMSHGYRRIVVNARDTDVLLLLISFSMSLTPEIWMRAGTTTKRRFIAIHKVTLPPAVRKNILAFHAVTGCDTTSKFAGMSKISTWKIYVQNPTLLDNFGNNAEPSEAVIEESQTFVCRLFDRAGQTTSIQEVRCSQFRKTKKSFENMPPTEDALICHLKRAHYQTRVWLESLTTHPHIITPIGNGWYLSDNLVKPVLMTTQPVSACEVDLVQCGCKQTGQKCQTRKCACMKSRLKCTRACSCGTWCENPQNTYNTDSE